MQTTTNTRQALGCGWEDPAPGGMVVEPWMPPGGRYGFDAGKITPEAPLGERAPKSCAGYTCGLPEVIEVAKARLHWTKGQLAVFTRGEPSERLLDLIEVLDSSYNAVQFYNAKPETEGGGMKVSR